MFRSLLSMSILFIAINHAYGGIIIDVQDATITAGTSSFVDVWLTGDLGDELGRFGYGFSISGATRPSGDLQFAVVQSNSEQTIGASPPDNQGYLFFGDTDPGNWNSTRFDAVTLRGGDALNSLDFVSIEGTFLLARLELLHTGPMSVASHAFTINLNPLSAFTEFDMDFDAGTNSNFSAGQITPLPGTITVNSAALPEPFTFALLGLIVTRGALRSRWKNRKQRTSLV